MTLNWNDLARSRGYHNVREYLAIRYYYPKEGSLKGVCSDLKVAEGSLLALMGRENLPTKCRGHPPKNGFYCEYCFQLRTFRDMRHNVANTQYICRLCLRKEQETISKGETK